MRSPATPQPDYLTVGQVADELGRPARTIHYWITSGRLAATKLGDGRTSAYMIPREEMEREKADSQQPRAG